VARTPPKSGIGRRKNRPSVSEPHHFRLTLHWVASIVLFCWRQLRALAGLVVVAGWLGMNYHFVDRLVAGAFPGTVTDGSLIGKG